MDKSLRTFDGIAPSTGERVYVDPCALVIGDVVMGDDANVWPVVVRGDMHSIRIGEQIAQQSYI